MESFAQESASRQWLRQSPQPIRTSFLTSTLLILLSLPLMRQTVTACRLP